MYQIIGKMCEDYWVYKTFVLYDYDTRKIITADEYECNYRNEIKGKVVNFDDGTVADGSETKLPVYNKDGSIKENKVPVVIERVTLNGETVGYTVIDENGVYKKFKTEDLIKRYKEFFNAKVVTKDGKTFISAKRGTFKELDLKNYNKKVYSMAEEIIKCSDAPDYTSFVCRESDYDISGGILYKYRVNDRKIRIPEGVEHIDKEAFCWSNKNECHVSTVDEVILQSSYNGTYSLKENELRDCFTLFNYYKPRNVYVADRNTHFRSQNGVVFSSGMHTLVFYPNKKDSAYKVPDGVQEIAYGAFNYSIYLKDLTLSSEVWCISDDIERDEDYYDTIMDKRDSVNNITFGCSSLMNINVVGSNKYFKSISGVLFDKTGSSLLLYPAGRKGVYTIPMGVKYIETFAFYGCFGLTEVNFPVTLKAIYAYAFLSCNDLKAVTIPSSVAYIEELAFDCDKIRDVTILGMKTEVMDYSFNFFNIKLYCLNGSAVDKTVTEYKEKVYIGGTE